MHDEAVVAWRGRRALLAGAAAIVLAVAIGLVLLWPGALRAPGAADVGLRVTGTVTALAAVPCGQGQAPTSATCLQAAVRLADGPERGQVVVLRTGPEPGLRPGRGVVLVRAGDEVPLADRYQYADLQRGRQLLGIGGLVVVVLLALGRRRTAMTLVALALSLVVLAGFVVPALLSGSSALLTAFVGAGAVLVLLLAPYGVNARTATALVGVTGGLVVAGLLGQALLALTAVSGLAYGGDFLAQAFGDRFDVRGLLLVGVVVGALGVLVDLALAQVAQVWRLRVLDPVLPRRDLVARSLRSSRGRNARGVSSLALAYAGASLPLLAVFTTGGDSVLDALTTDAVAQELLRLAVGGLGLAAAVPLTAALAAAVCSAPVPSADPVGVLHPASPLEEDREVDDPHSWGPRAAGEEPV